MSSKKDQIQSNVFEVKQKDLTEKDHNIDDLQVYPESTQNMTCWQKFKNCMNNFINRTIDYFQYDRVFNSEGEPIIDLKKCYKRFLQNYDETYSEREMRFAFSFDYVLQEKIKEQKKKEKNFWNQFYRFICCEGGNEMEEIDEAYKSQREYQRIIKKRLLQKREEFQEMMKNQQEEKREELQRQKQKQNIQNRQKLQQIINYDSLQFYDDFQAKEETQKKKKVENHTHLNTKLLKVNETQENILASQIIEEEKSNKTHKKGSESKRAEQNIFCNNNEKQIEDINNTRSNKYAKNFNTSSDPQISKKTSEKVLTNSSTEQNIITKTIYHQNHVYNNIHHEETRLSNKQKRNRINEEIDSFEQEVKQPLPQASQQIRNLTNTQKIKNPQNTQNFQNNGNTTNNGETFQTNNQKQKRQDVINFTGNNINYPINTGGANLNSYGTAYPNSNSDNYGKDPSQQNAYQLKNKKDPYPNTQNNTIYPQNHNKITSNQNRNEQANEYINNQLNPSNFQQNNKKNKQTDDFNYQFNGEGPSETLNLPDQQNPKGIHKRAQLRASNQDYQDVPMDKNINQPKKQANQTERILPTSPKIDNDNINIYFDEGTNENFDEPSQGKKRNKKNQQQAGQIEMNNDVDMNDDLIGNQSAQSGANKSYPQQGYDNERSKKQKRIKNARKGEQENGLQIDLNGDVYIQQQNFPAEQARKKKKTKKMMQNQDNQQDEITLDDFGTYNNPNLYLNNDPVSNTVAVSGQAESVLQASKKRRNKKQLRPKQDELNIEQVVFDTFVDEEPKAEELGFAKAQKKKRKVKQRKQEQNNEQQVIQINF